MNRYETVTIANQLGNTLCIEFIYPTINPEDYIKSISDVLYYAGVFRGIKKSATISSQK